MSLFSGSLTMIGGLAIGFGFQSLTRWSPWVNLAISFFIGLVLPPFWSSGLILGIWLCCAFMTYHPELAREYDIAGISWLRLIGYAGLTFSGFLLTLILLYRLKVNGSIGIGEREVVAWIFLGISEICLYKVISRLAPGEYKMQYGYGIAILNFAMLLYWIIPLGLYWMGLIFTTLLLIDPIILSLIDHSSDSGKRSMMGSR